MSPRLQSRRHIWVLRHAKAAKDSPSGDDHGRRLTKRGIAQAEETRRFVKGARTRGIEVPRVVLSSSAARALQTAELVLPGLGGSVTLEIEPELYQADPDDVVERIRRVEDDVRAVMVVGHNPTFADLVQLLVSVDEEDARRRLETFPTCAMAHLSADLGSWRDLAMGTADLEDLFVPGA